MSRFLPRSASVSVDFGTSHTVATLRRPDGRVHQQLFDGSPQLPSAVCVDDKGGPLTGADAVHHGRRRPDLLEPNPKRRIDDGVVLLGDRELSVTSLIAAVLARVAVECRRTVGGFGSVTVTVPAAWGPTRRHVIADAAVAAGLGAVAIVPEPVAAASYFAESLGAEIAVGSGVVVYDLGGGTFDATVLRRTASGFDVLAVDGADDLGGLDFDQALFDRLAATVSPDDPLWTRLSAPETPADRRSRAALLEEVRLAKERLSRVTATDLTLPLLEQDVHLTRDELERVAEPLLRRTVRITQGVIRESGLAPDQVTGLFLVGAASRTPLAATMLHRELGIAPSAIEQPELAVSEGGLLTQDQLSSPPAVPSPGLPPQTAPPVSSAPPTASAPTVPVPVPPPPPVRGTRAATAGVIAATVLLAAAMTAVGFGPELGLGGAETGDFSAAPDPSASATEAEAGTGTAPVDGEYTKNFVAVGDCMYEDMDLDADQWTVDCDEPEAFWSVVKVDLNPMAVEDGELADYADAEAVCGNLVRYYIPGEIWADYNFVYNTDTTTTKQFFCLQAVNKADEDGRYPKVPDVGDCIDDDPDPTSVPCDAAGALYQVTHAETIGPPLELTLDEVRARLDGCPDSDYYPWGFDWDGRYSGVVCYEAL
ncbi:Hsp70 family protein [Glycomyces paridis]|uniref:Hsp70 family protein n=1 Tax=Glycomyces paridis TaxID=2126555 RepID=A0A4S8P089_9ACTN|nr:Hsp70 family protein [Glycomyces paridis]THV23463.1 hypothetical protein E9998_22945 [Glycomyces paridis]